MASCSDPSLSALFAARWRARPDAVFLTLVGEDGLRPLTGAALLALAGRYAAALQARGVGAGDRVALVLSTSEAFLGAFFGAWWLGAVAVPLAPPRSAADDELLRVGRALVIAEASLAVVPDGTPIPPFSPVPLVQPRELLVACERVLAGPLPQAARPAAPPGEPALALLQFSSGSTGHPKGVALHDAALQANLTGIRAVLAPRPDDVGVAWLPLHHDMGLIGTLLYPLWAEFPTFLLPPELFIRQPARWIQLLGQCGATLTTGPNFGYALAAKLPQAATTGVDLTRLRAALVGAEPVRQATLQAFAARYAAHGFSPTAFVPTYGLAEATLAVSMPAPGQAPVVDRVARGALEAGRATRAVADAAGEARELVGLGPALPGVSLSIRDAAGAALAERQVGEVWVRSPALMAGYWRDEAATSQALGPGGWLRTGDLGYLAEGRLFIAGRLKDLIIRAGCKYHAADLEAIAEADPAVRPGGTAAFAVDEAGDRPERVVMLVEPRATEAVRDLPARVRQRVHAATGLRLDEVVAIQPRALPKTTSGKIQRGEARRRWLAGKLPPADAGPAPHG